VTLIALSWQLPATDTMHEALAPPESRALIENRHLREILRRVPSAPRLVHPIVGRRRRRRTGISELLKFAFRPSRQRFGVAYLGYPAAGCSDQLDILGW